LLVAIGRLTVRPDSPERVLAVAALLVGAGATASRGGLVAAVAGLAFLAITLGPSTLVRVGAPAFLGALVALGALAWSMPAGTSAKPLAAVAGLMAGVAVSLLCLRRPLAATLVAVLGTVTAAIICLRLWHSVDAPIGTRLSAASPDRFEAWRSAFEAWTSRPLFGRAPGSGPYSWIGSDGVRMDIEYVHNEYLQVLAELGVMGFGLLAGLVVAIVLAVRRGLRPGLLRATEATQPTTPHAVELATAAGLLAFAVGSSFDFYWHLPALVVFAALLLGIVTRPPGPRSSSRPPRHAHSPGLRDAKQHEGSLLPATVRSQSSA
jgi:O-antigen ligase